MRLRLHFVVMILVLCSTTAWSAKAKHSAIPLQQTASLSIGLTSFDYKEEWTPPDKSTENGWLFGVALQYSVKGGSEVPLFGRLAFDFSPSGTEYGSNVVDNFGRSRDFTSNSKDWFSRFELNAGYILYKLAGSSFDITPYTGYGYRFWRREIASAEGMLGYTEDYSWSYLPIGVRGDYTIDRSWSVGVDLALRVMVSGSIHIGLEMYKNPTLTLGKRLGFHMEVPVEYRITPGWALGASMWYEYSAIDQSNYSEKVVIGNQYGQVYEPASRTHQFGFAVKGMIEF
jgi:hypothetical protein